MERFVVTTADGARFITPAMDVLTALRGWQASPVAAQAKYSLYDVVSVALAKTSEEA